MTLNMQSDYVIRLKKIKAGYDYERIHFVIAVRLIMFIYVIANRVV